MLRSLLLSRPKPPQAGAEGQPLQGHSSQPQLSTKVSGPPLAAASTPGPRAESTASARGIHPLIIQKTRFFSIGALKKSNGIRCAGSRRIHSAQPPDAGSQHRVRRGGRRSLLAKVAARASPRLRWPHLGLGNLNLVFGRFLGGDRNRSDRNPPFCLDSFRHTGFPFRGSFVSTVAGAAPERGSPILKVGAIGQTYWEAEMIWLAFSSKSGRAAPISRIR